MDQAKLVAAFNEWMRRYTETPEQFSREWQAVSQYLAETADGKEPTYGQLCAAYLLELLKA